MENNQVDTKKYAHIVSEIEKFIESKKKKPTTVEGVVKKIDLSNNVLTIRLLTDYNPCFSRGSLVLIKEDSPESIDIMATIKEVYNSNVKLEIKTDPSMFEDKKIVIDTEKNNVILKRLKNVINNIKEGKINTDNIRILDLLINDNKPRYSQKSVSFISKNLNDDQKESVINSINADDFHLIIGPPGTGKTYVIEELIKQFTKRKQKTLITAWTNLAVDNVIKRLPQKETKNIIRIGPIDEVDSGVKKFSIFEKMKKHKDWKEVERERELRDELFKLIPRVKDEIDLTQKSINQNKDTSNILKNELDSLILEKKKYENLLSTQINKIELIDISQINEELTQIDNKSKSYLSLCKDILQMNSLQSKIPDIEKIRLLKKSTRNMKLSLVGKKISSFFSQNEKKIRELEKEYEKNKKYLDEIFKIEKEYNNLRNSNETTFNEIYPSGNGIPDKDALNFEFKAYKLLEEKYFPALKEQETTNTKISEINNNKEVYEIYLDSLNKKIELIDIKIKGINTEMYIQINNKDNLHKKYLNLVVSLEFYNKNIDKLIKSIIAEIVEKAEIIATTAVSSRHYFLDNINFDVCIMDEASQVASFMSLLPLLKCKKFILVGDNKQLQPIEEDISKEMNLSIFNRLFEMYPEASTFLSTQYRMHKTIAQIANEIFYEGKLRTSEQVAERILNLKVGKHLFLNPKVPVVFIDTSKVAYYEDEVGSSCSNAKEAKYVAYVVSLFIEKGIKREDIGVVTPYVKQKIQIEEFLKDIKIINVEVNTVHKFQGREKDIIIISFAKSKKYSFPLYKLKFIENETLVNVAITRAKKKLILIGNYGTLCQSKLLKNVFDKIGNTNRIIL